MAPRQRAANAKAGRARRLRRWGWAAVAVTAVVVFALEVAPFSLRRQLPLATGVANAMTRARMPIVGTEAAVVGDADLNGEFALDSAVLKDDRYRVRLFDGDRAVLTLVPEIQRAAETALKRAKAPIGAIVVMAPDGRLLGVAGREQGAGAAHSAPELTGQVWAPAASVFKVATTAAFLESGLSPAKTTCFHGGLRSIEAGHLKDHPADRDCGNLTHALAHSTNAIFAKLAHNHLSPNTLADVASRLGFDAPTPCALDAHPGTVEVPKTPLEFARVAAGFWNTQLSPLGGAVIAATVATRGLRVTPRVVDAVEHSDGRVTPYVSVPPKRVLKASVADTLATMMTETVKTGTAKAGFHDLRGTPFLGDMDVAGKTGSLTQRNPYRAYSWFVGFAPAEHPKVIVAVLLGNPEAWHLKAHTAARMVLQAAL